MKTPKEIELQDWVTSRLVNLDLYPFNVFFTYTNRGFGILGITFFIDFELAELLELIEYYNLCDKSGFTVIYESNTIIVSGNALLLLTDKLDEVK